MIPDKYSPWFKNTQQKHPNANAEKGVNNMKIMNPTIPWTYSSLNLTTSIPHAASIAARMVIGNRPNKKARNSLLNEKPDIPIEKSCVLKDTVRDFARVIQYETVSPL